MKKLYALLIILLFTLLGCSTLKLNKDLKKLNNLISIKGDVRLNFTSKSPIMISLFKTSGTYLESIEYIHKHKEGKFEFFVKTGKYKIYAWEDKNKNGDFERDEPITQCSITVKNQNDTQAYCTLLISEKANKQKLVEIHNIRHKIIDKLEKSHNIDTIINLDSDTFSELNASKGLWEPYTFTQEVPAGLFLLSKYDPNKEVVLFVHGINGTPQNFTHIIKNINPKTHQVLLFYYPSGLKINEVAYYMDYLLQEFQIKHELKDISIIAHSMGGLLSKEYINIQRKHGRLHIKNLITISTPWSGHKGAAFGLKYAPDVIPVWNDMAPKSQFLEKLFDVEYKKPLKHALLFGYKGSNLLVNENSDGVVTIDSQLRLEVQKRASTVRGFNEDHMSILKNRELVELINDLLEN